MNGLICKFTMELPTIAAYKEQGVHAVALNSDDILRLVNANNTRLTWGYSADMNIAVHALRQGWNELVMNAIDAGARNIEVNIESILGNVRVTVSDDGHGFSKDYLDDNAILNYQAKLSIGKNGVVSKKSGAELGGRGLGLARMTRSLSRGYGKVLLANDPDGSGAKITLTAPINSVMRYSEFSDVYNKSVRSAMKKPSARSATMILSLGFSTPGGKPSLFQRRSMNRSGSPSDMDASSVEISPRSF